MKNLFTILRSALPVVAVLALAVAVSLSSMTANAVTPVAVNTMTCDQPCDQPCDPSDCPLPCAKECTGTAAAGCNGCPMERRTVEQAVTKTVAAAESCDRCVPACVGSNSSSTKSVAHVM